MLNYAGLSKTPCKTSHGSIKYKQVKLHKNSVVRLANAVFTIIRSYLYLPMQVAFFFAIQENSGSVGSDTLNAFLLAIMLSIAVLLSVYALSTRIAIHFVVDTPSRLANASSFCFSSSESLTPTCFFVSAIRFFHLLSAPCWSYSAKLLLTVLYHHVIINASKFIFSLVGVSKFNIMYIIGRKIIIINSIKC